MTDKISRTHLERTAVVYLRQSTMRQVHACRESTARQYALQQRAIDLGWGPEDVRVVDEDLGQSGTSTTSRDGFRRLAEDVAHGRVGAIFALEPSRFARNSADWHQLLELCRLADVLIGDEHDVYAPRDGNDRLLLGLKGQMSEAEQYWMRLRLQGAKLSKARRGELFVHPPTGYQWDEAVNRLCLDPDEQAQRAVRLVFERFRLDGSAYAVMRYFERNGLQLPARQPGTGTVQWGPPRHSSILRTLHNPLYTGAYVYGRREERAALVDGQLHPRRVSRIPQENWKVCLRDHHPAYISWEAFMDNQDKLHHNRTNHAVPDQRGAAREGTALLQGIVLCGKCGERMGVRYDGKSGRPHYECRSPTKRLGRSGVCWTVSGRPIDEAVAALFLEAAQPPEIELSLAVAREAERQAEEVERQWKLRLDRVDYEAKLAERRYMAVDPDNRVVARTLERNWEEKLREVERVQREYQDARRREKVELTEEDRQRILALARDLPRVWEAPTTSAAQRKNLLRMLVREVALTPIEVPSRRTKTEVLWVTGAVTEITVGRPSKETASATPAAAVECVRELVAAGQSSNAIACELNRRGLRTGKGHPWTVKAVHWVRSRHGLGARRSNRPVPEQREDGLFSTKGVAARLDVTVHVVRYWIGRGLIHPADGGGRGRPAWFHLDEETVERLEAAKDAGYGPRGRRSNSRSQHP